jgi:hypothetical protein
MNKEVNFEIAKILKEKGFDTIDCGGYYHVCDGYTKGYAYCYSDVNTQKENAILAPTIAEVVMWLYEEHGVWINVDVDINGKFRHIVRKYNSNDRAWEVRKSFTISEYCNSPTEAYETAIKYTLKKLI